MLKAGLTTKDGGKIVLLGLSHANLDRLRRDGFKGFIKIEGRDVGLADSCEIIITAGETEHKLLDEFKDLIGEATVLRISDKLKS